MAKRGRVSVSELLTQTNGPVETVQRPDAPYELDDEEADEWRAQVAAMPADHFTRNAWPLLAQMCQHIVAFRRLAQIEKELTKPKKKGEKQVDLIGAYASILKAKRAESQATQRLARSMRLTPQSYTRAENLGTQMKKARASTMVKLPWESNEGEEVE